MPPPIRRVIVLVALAASLSGAAAAQTVCDQLLPIGLIPPAGGFLPGCATRYVLRYGSSGAAGRYQWLAYPPCPNGPCAGLAGPLQFVCEAANGHACCVSALDMVPLPAGTYAGPLRSGLSQRFASDTDTLAGICFSEYAGNGARLVNVPLIHSFGISTTQVQVVGFVRMFLVNPLPGNGDLTAEFVDGPTPTHGATWGRTKLRYRQPGPIAPLTAPR